MNLENPRLHLESGLVRLRYVKVRAVLLVLAAVGALITAALADGKHHREVLRCTRHASRHAREDNDCVLIRHVYIVANEI